MTSQPMTVSARSPECTSSSMAALKRDTVAAKTGYRSSVSRYQAAYTCTAQATSVTIADTVAKVGVDSKTKRVHSAVPAATNADEWGKARNRT